MREAVGLNGGLRTVTRTAFSSLLSLTLLCAMLLCSVLLCLLVAVGIIGAGHVCRRGRVRCTNILGEVAERPCVPVGLCWIRPGRKGFAGGVGAWGVINADTATTTLCDVVAFVGGVLVSRRNSWISRLSHFLSIIGCAWLAAWPRA